MRKEKKTSRYHESLTIKQAQNKNYGLEEHSKFVGRIYEQEKKRRAEEIDKERKRIVKEIKRTRRVFPLPGHALNNLHRRRSEKIDDMCMHVVSCYMHRQEKNKYRWMQEVKEGNLAYRPVCTPDHLLFVKDVFPEAYRNTVEIGYMFKHKESADIYEYGRAAHDRKCASTKAKALGESIGAYPPKEAVNVRFWKPLTEDLRDSPKQRWRDENSPQQRLAKGAEKERDEEEASVIKVPSLGLVEVGQDGVFVISVENERGDQRVTKLVTHRNGR